MPVTPHPPTRITRIFYIYYQLYPETQSGRYLYPSPYSVDKSYSYFGMFGLNRKDGWLVVCFCFLISGKKKKEKKRKEKKKETKKRKSPCGLLRSEVYCLCIHWQSFLEITLAKVGHSLVFSMTHCQPSLSSLWKMPNSFFSCRPKEVAQTPASEISASEVGDHVPALT